MSWRLGVKDGLDSAHTFLARTPLRCCSTLHTASHQEAYDISCPPFNDSEFDHLINGASCDFYLDTKSFTLPLCLRFKGFISVPKPARNSKLIYFSGLF